jgi:hypothetical protein
VSGEGSVLAFDQEWKLDEELRRRGVVSDGDSAAAMLFYLPGRRTLLII